MLIIWVIFFDDGSKYLDHSYGFLSFLIICHTLFSFFLTVVMAIVYLGVSSIVAHTGFGGISKLVILSSVQMVNK